jgi:hypothetical protein
MREYNQAQQQAKQGEEEFLFVSRSCEAFLAELKSIEDEGDLPVPMVKVVQYEAKTFLLIATAKFYRDFGSTGGYDQVGTAVDHCKPEEHPLAVSSLAGPMVRSNRDRRSNADPDRVFWVRAIELVGEALVRFWVNPCHRPGTTKSGNQNTFYSILADGSINDLTEAEYKALNTTQSA